MAISFLSIYPSLSVSICVCYYSRKLDHSKTKNIERFLHRQNSRKKENYKFRKPSMEAEWIQ